jgi:hypothetical protein
MNKFKSEIQKIIDRVINQPDIVNKSGRITFDETHPPIGRTVYDETTNFSYLYPSPNRLNRYREYEMMDIYDTYISTALDIYADNATQKDINKKVIIVKTPDKDIKYILEKLLYDKIIIEEKIWEIVRGACQYGDSFWEIVFNKNNRGVGYITPLPPQSMVRIESKSHLKGFIQNLAYMPRIEGALSYPPNTQNTIIEIPPAHILHFKIASTVWSYYPYGTSMLDKIRRLWRIIRLLEDAMMVYRVTRAPERRVFKIPVPTMMTAEQRDAYMRDVINKFRKKPFVNQFGELDNIPNILPPDEDFFIPVTPEGSAEIDTLPGASNLSEIDDVKYFRDRLFAALRIPRIYLQDVEGGAENRRQNLAQQDIQFARLIERIQNQILRELYKLCAIELILQGKSMKEIMNFRLSFSSASALNESAKAEEIKNKSEIANSLKELGIPLINSVPLLFDISEEEYIHYIELLIAEKKALDEGDIKDYRDLFNKLKAEKEKIKRSEDKGEKGGLGKIEVVNEVVCDLHLRNELALELKENLREIYKTSLENQDKDEEEINRKILSIQ